MDFRSAFRFVEAHFADLRALGSIDFLDAHAIHKHSVAHGNNSLAVNRFKAARQIERAVIQNNVYFGIRRQRNLFQRAEDYVPLISAAVGCGGKQSGECHFTDFLHLGHIDLFNPYRIFESAGFHNTQVGHIKLRQTCAGISVRQIDRTYVVEERAFSDYLYVIEINLGQSDAISKSVFVDFFEFRTQRHVFQRRLSEESVIAKFFNGREVNLCQGAAGHLTVVVGGKRICAYFLDAGQVDIFKRQIHSEAGFGDFREIA